MKYIKILSLMWLMTVSTVYGYYVRPVSNANIVGGEGSYFTPLKVSSPSFSWKVDVPSDYETSEYTFAIEVHLDGYRNCSTQFFELAGDWQSAEANTYSYDGFQTGKYYFRLSARKNGEIGNYLDVGVSKRLHVFFVLPPFKSYSRPYREPRGNSAPTPHFKVLNLVGGTGTNSNPFQFAGSVIVFEMWATDSNGSDDIKNGAMLWCIERMSDGPHSCLLNPHRYMKAQGGGGDNNVSPSRALADTYANYAEMNEIQSFDFNGSTCITSISGLYKIQVEALDQWGADNTTFWYVTFAGDSDRTPPTRPVGVHFENGESAAN
ncbi:hypothetical protein KAH55_10145 [bacterium]|nr:hypothetical protein [bacterium]